MPKISALTSLAQASVDTAADVLPIVDATAPATTKKVTVQAMVNAGLAAAAPQGGIFALTGALTVSGTSTLGVTRASAADGAITFGVSGTTRGFRIYTSSYGTAIEGMDNTLVGSYQPMNVIASALGLYTTGGNAIALGTSAGTPQMNVANTTSAVNFAQITGGVTGNAVRYGVGGSDSNIAWAASSNGTFGLGLYTNNFTNLQFAVSHTASAVNYLNFTGAATGNAVTISTGGSDANRSIAITPAGTGTVQLGLTRVSGADASSPLFGVSGTTRGVRIYTSSYGTAIEGMDNTLVGSYQPMNVIASALGLYTTGGNAIALGTSAGTPQMYVTNTTSAVNFAQITGGVTGNAVTASAAGSDSNIDFAITPKGTGNVCFGTHSALAAETVTGYITIKDSAGNTRKLAVLS